MMSLNDGLIISPELPPTPHPHILLHRQAHAYTLTPRNGAIWLL